MIKKILTRIFSFLRIKYPVLYDDDFDIILDREHKELIGPRNFVISSSKPAAASITWEGAVRLFPSPYWIRLSLDDLIVLLSHEIMHIVIGQNQGIMVSKKYDDFIGGRMAACYPPYSSDLFKRLERETRNEKG